MEFLAGFRVLGELGDGAARCTFGRVAQHRSDRSREYPSAGRNPRPILRLHYAGRLERAMIDNGDDT